MAQGSTITKRIKLEVSSPAPNLSGITAAVGALNTLNTRLERASALGSHLATVLGNTNFTPLAVNAETAASRVATAMESAAARARAAIATISAAPISIPTAPIPPATPGRGRGGGGGSGRSPIRRAAGGFTLEGLISRGLTAGSWMVAYAGISKTTEVVDYSIKRLMELQLQLGVLRQTFRGAGGSAVQLADDVLKLAAAEGRSTEEAMRSGVAWSRLGLDRRQTAEAVRASLVTANLANIDAGESTEKLSAVFSAFNLQSSDLASTIGMLAKTGQSYRVTIGDLLNGLTRVSGTAKAANLSLAETQALIGVLSNKTGLPGAQVGNSLQVFLSRLNLSTTQEFFERRYGLKLTGRGSDFGEIYKIYRNANELERRDISLRVGTGRQTHAFNSLMAGYPDVLDAARSSLLNLNAAEEENIKITNTAHAAWQRLGASWDRVINSPGADRAIAGLLNRSAGTLQGLANTLGESAPAKAPTYFDPRGANLKGALGAFLSYGAVVPGKIADLVSGGKFGTWRDKNLGLTDQPTTPEDIFSKNMREIISRRSAGEAYGEGAKLAALKGDKKAEASELAKKKENLAVAQRLTDAEEKRLTDALKAAKTEDEKLSISRQLAEVKRETNALDYDALETTDRMALRTEELTRVMTAQRLLAEDIANTLKGIGLPKWVEDSAATAGQLSATRAMIAAAEKAGPGADDELYKQTLDSLKKEALGLDMRQQYQQSPIGRSYAQAESFKTTAARMTGFEVEGQGVGISEGERALDRRRWIQQEMKKYNDTSKMDQADLARAAVLLNSLKETEFSIQQRILNIERERKQVLIESQREFQRSLITAGPGEILRKLALNSVTRGGRMGAGQFFSMSPEMRGDAYTLMGGDRMAQLNWEKKALSGQGMDVKTMQNRVWSGEQRGEQIASAIISAHAKAASHAASVAKSMEAAASAAAVIARVLGGIKIASGGSGNGGGNVSNSAPVAAPVPQAVPVPQSNQTDNGRPVHRFGPFDYQLGKHEGGRPFAWGDRGTFDKPGTDHSTRTSHKVSRGPIMDALFGQENRED